MSLLNTFKDVPMGHFLHTTKQNNFFILLITHKNAHFFILKSFYHPQKNFHHLFSHIPLKVTSNSGFLCISPIQFLFLLFFHLSYSIQWTVLCLYVLIIKQSLSLIYFSSTDLPIKRSKITQMGGRVYIFTWKMFLFLSSISFSKICSFLLSWTHSHPGQSLSSFFFN